MWPFLVGPNIWHCSWIAELVGTPSHPAPLAVPLVLGFQKHPFTTTTSAQASSPEQGLLPPGRDSPGTRALSDIRYGQCRCTHWALRNPHGGQRSELGPANPEYEMTPSPPVLVWLRPGAPGQRCSLPSSQEMNTYAHVRVWGSSRTPPLQQRCVQWLGCLTACRVLSWPPWAKHGSFRQEQQKCERGRGAKR